MSNFMSISQVRADLPDVVKKINKNMDRVVITVSGKPQAVLVSQDELESWEETVEILSIPGARESIKKGLKDVKAGRVTPLEDVIKELKLDER